MLLIAMMPLEKTKHIIICILIVVMTLFTFQGYIYGLNKNNNLMSLVNEIEEDHKESNIKDVVVRPINRSVINSNNTSVFKLQSNFVVSDEAKENQNFVLFIGEPPEYLI